MAIVSLRGIRKAFDSNEVLKGIDLEVEAGEVVAIIGPSGSGKSTLLRCINLLERPTAGTVVLDGRVLASEAANGAEQYASAKVTRAARVDVGMVFQHFNLFPHMTAVENIVEAPMAVRHMPRAAATETAVRLLGQVGLADKARAYPSQLSGGQRQRLAIARALAMEPKVMLFDEVTSSVDPELAGEILYVMKRLAQAGMTMLVVTHEMQFARDVADRVVFLDDGVIKEEGPAKEVLTNPKNPRTRRFLHAVIDRAPMDDRELSAPPLTVPRDG